MIIYVDILIACNILIDYFLLLFCAVVCHIPVRRMRIFLAALLGGASSLLILVQTAAVLCRCAAIVVGVIMCLIAFGSQKRQKLFKSILCLYALGFIFSAFFYAVWFFLSPNGLYWHNGYIYFSISPLQFALLTAAVYGIFTLTRYILRFTHTHRGRIFQLTLQSDCGTVQGHALLDTGNLLTEPISGEAVIVVDRDFAAPILPLLTDLNEKVTEAFAAEFAALHFRYVQFHTIAGGGLLPAGKVKKICSADVELCAAESLYIALCPNLLVQTGCEAVVPETALRTPMCQINLLQKEGCDQYEEPTPNFMAFVAAKIDSVTKRRTVHKRRRHTACSINNRARK